MTRAWLLAASEAELKKNSAAACRATAPCQQKHLSVLVVNPSIGSHFLQTCAISVLLSGGFSTILLQVETHI